LRVTPHNITPEEILESLENIDLCSDGPDEGIVPYYELSIRGDTYYLTAGGYLFRKNTEMKETGGFFCGHLSNGVWHPRKDNP
jgi:hypothetical protein